MNPDYARAILGRIGTAEESQWEDGYQECRLVAADGEIIGRVRSDYRGEWQNTGTGKWYTSKDAAKQAAAIGAHKEGD